MLRQSCNFILDGVDFMCRHHQSTVQMYNFQEDIFQWKRQLDGIIIGNTLNKIHHFGGKTANILKTKQASSCVLHSFPTSNPDVHSAGLESTAQHPLPCYPALALAIVMHVALAASSINERFKQDSALHGYPPPPTGAA